MARIFYFVGNEMLGFLEFSGLAIQRGFPMHEPIKTGTVTTRD